jgi:hypothetical protein
MKNKLKLAYCLALFLCISTQITNAQTTTYPAYHASHFCSSYTTATTGICGYLNKIRLNGTPSTTTSDALVLLAAHRGLWGGDVPENTEQAFADAITGGYKLLEADIMPTGITNINNPTSTSDFGTPKGMVCFHDFKLKRMTDSTSDDFVFSKSVEQLVALKLRKPRALNETPVTSVHKIYSMKNLVTKAYNNDAVACLDVKNLENSKSSDTEGEIPKFNSDERKLLSLAKNIKWILNNTETAQLRNVAIKTYQSYTAISDAVLAGEGANSTVRTNFNKILWIPMIADNTLFKGTDGFISVTKVNAWIANWNANKERVLYFEVNINSGTHLTAKLLEKLFLSAYFNGDRVSACNGINRLTGRRVGIFSEDPVGSRGTVNRWGTWKYKDPSQDRRGDPFYLMNDIPEMKKGVITTDRPDAWINFRNTTIN